MTHSRLVFDRLKTFLPSETDIVIPLGKKSLQPIKSLTNLMRQLVQYPDEYSVKVILMEHLMTRLSPKLRLNRPL